MANEVSLAASVAHLREEGLVAFPTETVWGLAVRADSDAALSRLARCKGRSSEQPIAVMVPEPASLIALDFEVSELAQQLIDRHWPGPLTLVLRCRRSFGRGIARADGAVGVRCSSHPAASALCRAAFEAGVGPITATSLNRSGRPPAATCAEAEKLCKALRAEGEIPAYHGGYEAGGEVASTVLDLAGSLPRLLRAGALRVEIPGADVWVEAIPEESC